MKIQEGKRYITKSGEITDRVVRVYSVTRAYPYAATIGGDQYKTTFADDGRVFLYKDSYNDLVEEYVEDTTLQERVTELEKEVARLNKELRKDIPEVGSKYIYLGPNLSCSVNVYVISYKILGVIYYNAANHDGLSHKLGFKTLIDLDRWLRNNHHIWAK